MTSPSHERYISSPKGKATARRASARWQRNLHQRAIMALGGKCVNSLCLVPGGCVDLRCLQIDHIHGNGKKELRGIGQNTVYMKIVRNPEEAKKEYQVLCANCNWIKRAEKREVNFKFANKTTILTNWF